MMAFDPWSAALIAGGSLISGWLGNEAAGAQADASAAAVAESGRQFDLGWNALAPMRYAGYQSLGNMSILTGGQPPPNPANYTPTGAPNYASPVPQNALIPEVQDAFTKSHTPLTVVAGGGAPTGWGDSPGFVGSGNNRVSVPGVSGGSVIPPTVRNDDGTFTIFDPTDPTGSNYVVISEQDNGDFAVMDNAGNIIQDPRTPQSRPSASRVPASESSGASISNDPPKKWQTRSWKERQERKKNGTSSDASDLGFTGNYQYNVIPQGGTQSDYPYPTWDNVTAKSLVMQDPSYKFRYKQGEDATKNYLSSSNRRLGGSALKALTRYGQDYASQEYGNMFNRNAVLAGYTPAASQVPANNIPQMIQQGGNAQAGGSSAWNNAIQGGIQNYISYDTNNNWLSRFGGNS